MPTLRTVVKPACSVASACSPRNLRGLILRAREIDGQVRRVLGPIGEVGVHVDQAGQARVPAEDRARADPSGGSDPLASEAMRPPRMITVTSCAGWAETPSMSVCAMNGN